MPPVCTPLSDDLVDFLQSGIPIDVGIADEARMPTCLRAAALRVHEDRSHLTLLVPDVRTRGLAEPLREGMPIAIVVSRPVTHRSVQVKGLVQAVAAAPESMRRITDDHLHGLLEAFEAAGIARRITRRFNQWPCLAVEVRIDSVFHQTPGPGAGAPFPS